MRGIDLPWQQAVYTRRTARDPFTFSHVKHTSVPKTFCSSLSVPSLSEHPGIVKRNVDAFTEATVLVLVTGHWAQEYSLAAFTANYHPVMRSHERIAPVKYDHLDRLGARSNRCSELSVEFSSIQLHSTMTHFLEGQDHAWRVKDCIPIQSDMVILPRVLEMDKIERVMRSFHRAIRKSLRDSVYMAGAIQYREENLSAMRKPPFPSLPPGSPLRTPVRILA